MAKAKLTDRGLQHLKTPLTGQLDVWDATLPGFGVRIGHGGRKAFVVGTRINGRFKRFTLKPPYPQLSLADARAQAQKIIADAQSGIDPAAAQARERHAAIALNRNLFGAVAGAFMQDHAANLRSRSEMQRKLNVELLPAWADRPIASITRADVKSLLRETARRSPIGANRLLALISSIFSWALEEEIVQASPAARLKRPGAEHARERVLTADEIAPVWHAFNQLHYPFGGLFKLQLVTAQRRGEIAGMRWCEIDGDGWVIPGTRAKSGVGHRVPLSSLAREILDGLPRIGEHVFSCRADKPPRDFSGPKARVASLTPGMAPWVLHDLRRTAATQMRSVGIDRLVVSKLLNHAEAGVTRVYDRYAADPEKIAAMERWANRLRSIIAGETDQKVVELRKAAP